MKLVLVYDHRGNQPLYEDGEPRSFPAFIWFMLYTDNDGWRANLFCFLNAVTDDLKFQSYQGIFCWGHYQERWFLDFTPEALPIPVWPLRKFLKHLRGEDA